MTTLDAVFTSVILSQGHLLSFGHYIVQSHNSTMESLTFYLLLFQQIIAHESEPSTAEVYCDWLRANQKVRLYMVLLDDFTIVQWHDRKKADVLGLGVH